MSIETFAQDGALDAVFNNTAFSVGQAWIQLHTGDPGTDGTDNVANSGTRQSLSTGDSVDGVVTTDDDLTWTNVSDTETYSHVSIWDAETDGNFLWSGELDDPVDVNAGNAFDIPTGTINFSLD